MMAVVGEPGDLAALTLEGRREDYLAPTGPTWRDEIDATVGLQLGAHGPITEAKNVACPMLVQIADFDRSARPSRAGPRCGTTPATTSTSGLARTGSRPPSSTRCPS